MRKETKSWISRITSERAPRSLGTIVTASTPVALVGVLLMGHMGAMAQVTNTRDSGRSVGPVRRAVALSSREAPHRVIPQVSVPAPAEPQSPAVAEVREFPNGWDAPDPASRADWTVAERELHRNRRFVEHCLRHVQPIRHSGTLWITTKVEDHRAALTRVLVDSTRNTVLEECLVTTQGWHFGVESGELDMPVHMVAEKPAPRPIVTSGPVSVSFLEPRLSE